tara:strand:- start:63 stop:383 length:321 start_codon:yes stop_codon:yes gene_type:complete
MSDNEIEDIHKLVDGNAHNNAPRHITKKQAKTAVANDESEDLLQQGLRKKLEELQSEHHDLDEVINRLSVDTHFDQLQRQRLKKRKLSLKDAITRLRGQILPDIIA